MKRWFSITGSLIPHSILITIGVFTLTTILCPTEWDFYDSFNAHLINGIATQNVISEFYLGFPLLPVLFINLQKTWDTIPWVGLFFGIILFVANSIFTLIVYHEYKKKYPECSAICVLSILFPLVFIIQAQSIHKMSMTGISILVCGAAILFIEKYSFITKNKWTGIAIIVLMSICFLAGICIRFDTTIAVGALCILYLILSTKNFIKSLFSILPLVLIFIGITIYTLSRIDNVSFVKENELQLVYLSDGDNDNNFFNKLSDKDKIKYQAVNRFFIVDSMTINEGLIQFLAKKKFETEKELGFNFYKRMMTAWELLKPTIINNWQYAVLNFLILIFSILKGLNLRKIMLFQLSFWMMIFSIAYIARIEDRHYIYLAQVFTYCNMMLMIDGSANYNPKTRQILPVSLLLLFIFVIMGFRIQAQAQNVRIIHNNLSAAEKELNKLGKDKIVLLDGSSKNVFHAAPLVVRRFCKTGAIIYYDMGHLALLPEYNEYLNKICNCNSRSIVEFYKFISENKDKILIVSTDERQEFIMRYFEKVYKKQLIINKNQGNFHIEKVIINGEQLHYYTLALLKW